MAVHLRIETFYVLATRLLDKVAQAVEQYLGPAQDVPLASHRELQENLAAFADQKRLLDVPASLLAKAQRLAGDIDVDRDLHVRLARGPRRMTASLWSASGDAGIGPGSSRDSVTLRELLDRLEEYVEDVLDYLETNRQRSGVKQPS